MATDDQKLEHLSDAPSITLNVDDVDAGNRIQTDALPSLGYANENPATEDLSLLQISRELSISTAVSDGCALSKHSARSSPSPDGSPPSISYPLLQPPGYDSTVIPRSSDAPYDLKIFEKEYRMDHEKRGMCLIFNHEVFDDRKDKRHGTDADAYRLKRCFEDFGFEVHQFDNFCHSEIVAKLVEVSSKDHSDADCFCCCFLTHGDDGEVLSAKDRVYEKRIVFEHFNGENCKTLAGKPKIFLIQACRGNKVDLGVYSSVQSDAINPPIKATKKPHKIHSKADFLISQATVEGYESYRDIIDGSWFINTLVPLLVRYGTVVDLVTILTKVSNDVNKNFAGSMPERQLEGLKQIPQITSTLTKKLIFRKKLDQKEIPRTRSYPDKTVN